MATNTKSKKKTSSSKKTTAKTSSAPVSRKKKDGISIRAEIILICLIVFSVLLFLSNFGLVGSVGECLASFLYGVFGIMSYVFPFALMLGSIFAVSNKKNKHAIFKLVFAGGLFLFICMISLFFF